MPPISVSDAARVLAARSAEVRRVERERLDLMDEYFREHPRAYEGFQDWLRKRGP